MVQGCDGIKMLALWSGIQVQFGFLRRPLGRCCSGSGRDMAGMCIWQCGHGNGGASDLMSSGRELRCGSYTTFYKSWKQ